MRDAQIFRNKPTDYATGIMKLVNPTHHTEECSPYWVKRVHVSSLDVEGTVFQTF